MYMLACTGTELSELRLPTYLASGLEAHAFQIRAGLIDSVHEVFKHRHILVTKKLEIIAVDIGGEKRVGDIGANVFDFANNGFDGVQEVNRHTLHPGIKPCVEQRPTGRDDDFLPMDDLARLLIGN